MSFYVSLTQLIAIKQFPKPLDEKIKDIYIYIKQVPEFHRIRRFIVVRTSMSSDVTPCSLAHGCQIFRGKSKVQLQNSTAALTFRRLMSTIVDVPHL